MNEASQTPAVTGALDEVKRSIAERVRGESKELVKLTPLSSFSPEGGSLKPEEVETKITEMAGEEEYADIKSVTAATGAVYLYSGNHISDSYAAILARVEADDPCLTIAGTVRDEARVYYRPTKYEFLADPVFGMQPEKLEQHINATLERDEFRDIKSIAASTGARYLYSDLYLSERYAKRQVEWDEVERYENP